jgi:hypothetical protein
MTSNLQIAAYQFLPTNSHTYKLQRCTYGFIYLYLGIAAYQFRQRCTYKFTYKKLHINLYNVVPMNSSTIINYEHVTSDICHLVDENNQWSSTILIPQGDGFLDISSALMGDLSATLVGATKQPTIFPTGKSASFYCFDPDLYQGEESLPPPKEMLINAARVSGCRLSTNYMSL